MHDQFDELDVDGIGAEVFEVLVSTTSGDELQVAYSGGFEAWWKSVNTRAPWIVAWAVRLVGMATSPPKVTDLAKMDVGAFRWEEHQRTLRFNSSEAFRIGILLKMLPQYAPDFALQSMDAEARSEDMMEWVNAFASSKVAIFVKSGSAAMDIGGVMDGQDGDEDIGVLSMSHVPRLRRMGTPPPKIPHCIGEGYFKGKGK